MIRRVSANALRMAADKKRLFIVQLAIVSTHLGEEPEGFAPAGGAAVADGGGAVVVVTEAGGGAGGELFGLEDKAGI